jgi:hypothetical protein
MMTVDESQFPVVYVRFDGTPTEDDVEGYIALLQRHFSAEHRFAILLETASMGVPAVRLVKRIAVWLKENDDAFGRHVVCLGFVTSSAAMRGAIRFVNSLAPPASPQQAFGDLESARNWIGEQLAAGD